MAIGEAADVFVKLSVGDGLVTQIPALIVSLAAGLLVSKGGTRGSADQAVFGQLGAYPRALYVAALLLAVLGIMPGLPMLPFFALAGGMTAIGYIIPLRHDRRVAEADKVEKDKQASKDEEERNSIKSSLKTAEIELLIGKQLSTKLLDHASGTGLPDGQDAQEIRHAIRLRRSGSAPHRRLQHSEQELPDQGARHRRGRAPGARRRGHGAARQSRRARHSGRGSARAGLRHARLFGARNVRRGSEARELRLCRQHVGAAHASLRSDPQQPAAAAVLQGHEGAAGTAGPGIPQARRRDLHLAHHLSRPAGGAEAAARRARLDPQPAPDHRGDRRDRAACAPHRADRRACAHPHGAADLRRPLRATAC